MCQAFRRVNQVPKIRFAKHDTELAETQPRFAEIIKGRFWDGRCPDVVSRNNDLITEYLPFRAKIKAKTAISSWMGSRKGIISL
jgi:hypothetical protein